MARSGAGGLSHSVSHLRHGEDETWIPRAVPKLATDVADNRTDEMTLSRVFRAPYSSQYLVVRQHAAGIARQLAQELVLGRSEVHLLTGNGYAPCREVYGQLFELEERAHLKLINQDTAAQGCLDSGNQFGR